MSEFAFPNEMLGAKHLAFGALLATLLIQSSLQQGDYIRHTLFFPPANAMQIELGLFNLFALVNTFGMVIGPLAPSSSVDVVLNIFSEFRHIFDTQAHRREKLPR